MTPHDATREAFERWERESWSPDVVESAMRRDVSHGYLNLSVDNRWEAWQAALASARAERGEGGDKGAGAVALDYCPDDVAEALVEEYKCDIGDRGLMRDIARKVSEALIDAYALGGKNALSILSDARAKAERLGREVERERCALELEDEGMDKAAVVVRRAPGPGVPRRAEDGGDGGGVASGA